MQIPVGAKLKSRKGYAKMKKKSAGSGGTEEENAE